MPGVINRKNILSQSAKPTNKANRPSPLPILVWMYVFTKKFQNCSRSMDQCQVLLSVLPTP